ncbi:MAG TPA: (Fe-S)-binding protein [Bacteroidia bacterium]|nr:(Fe-S)-binding protein [Bacteroidia bacterium]HRS57974.1 (Fe-S)-binding protein [Bacteroidia bacterium]HRU68571.1 (Fe-S)-binding protein [Bacteroidia bacterium]
MSEISKQNLDKALNVLNTEEDGKLLTHLNACVHCALCADSCLYYNVFHEDKYIPAHKVELVTSVYRRYKTLSGKYLPGLTKAKDLDDKTITEMIDLLFGACTMCGRCVSHCSIGVDIAYLVRKGREMLSALEKVPETLQSTVQAAVKTGNNMAIPVEDLVDTLTWLEEDLKDDTGDETARIPLNEEGKNVLYTLNPREPKFFPLSISAMAKIFHAAGESWTLSTEMYDVTNYAYFSGNDEEAAIIARRLYETAKKLGVKRIVLAECGHGSRAFRWEAPNYLKQEFDIEVITSVELIEEYIRQGRIKVDKSKNRLRVTLHDPCNLVRLGGIFSQQRYILQHTVSDFEEMNPYGYENLCCGGGGGQLSMSEYNERRMKIGGLKANQIRETGAKVVVTPCHNCVDQLLQINGFYKLNVQIKTMAEIVADALI